MPPRVPRDPARRVHVHTENRRRSAPVFEVTPELFAAAATRHSEVGAQVEPSFGRDLEEFDAAMRTAEVIIGWRVPREGLRARAPHLRWIHLKGAGVEHLLPLDWLPADLTLTNNKGVHTPKAGEFATMALLMPLFRQPRAVPGGSPAPQPGRARARVLMRGDARRWS